MSKRRATPRVIFPPAQERVTLSDPELNIFYQAPVLLIVLAKSNEPQARMNCCLAAHTLMLAAGEATLGTCWIGLACHSLAIRDCLEVEGPFASASSTGTTTNTATLGSA